MSMADLECKIMNILSKHICTYENCSDSEDKQFPECNDQSSKRNLCSIAKFGVFEVTKDIMKEIEKYEVDIIPLQGDTFPDPKTTRKKIVDKNLIQEDLL